MAIGFLIVGARTVVIVGDPFMEGGGRREAPGAEGGYLGRLLLS